MIEFYNHFIHTKSTHRSKLIVQLFAQGNAESKQRMNDLLKTLSDETDEVREAVRSALMHAELRDDTSALGKVMAQLKLSADKTNAVLAAAKDPATEPKTEGSKDQGVKNGLPANGIAPILIDEANVRLFKTSLQVTSGAQPVKDITEFEDIEPKL
jgi:insulysin